MVLDNILPDLNITNVWFAPSDAINSTEAFLSASHLEEQAYTANKWLFIAIMIILGGFILFQVPYTFSRMRRSNRWDDGFRLKTNGSSTVTAPNDNITQLESDRRLPHFTLPIPIKHVPFFDLTLPEFLIVAVLWAAGLGVAAWCQSAFLTHTSRSTLIIMALLSLTAALGIKAGGVGTWIAMGYTAVNFLHRWMGRLVWFLATGHVVAYLIVFRKAGIMAQEMKKPENYLGAVGYAGLCLTGLLSVGYIRRRSWLLFKLCHHLGILLVMAGLNYHSRDVVPYLLAIWALIVINTTFRSITTRYTIATLTPLPGATSTCLKLPLLCSGWIPGQHVRIRLLCLGWKGCLESHPFTIATANGTSVELVIKVAGDWTEKLLKIALLPRVNGKAIRVRCLIEGPYGGPLNFDFKAFSSVMVVVGGSGISFGLGVVKGLLYEARARNGLTRQLVLVWTVRDLCQLEALNNQIQDIVVEAQNARVNSHPLHLSIRLHYTAKERSHDAKINPGILCREIGVKPVRDCSVEIETNNCRPDVAGILREVTDATCDGGAVGVGGCGPGGMILDLERAVARLSKSDKKRVGGVELHAERFSL